MANLLVVGRLPEKANIPYANGYRGVERASPDYPVEFYKSNSNILDIHSKYYEYLEEDSYIHDLTFAISLRDVYSKYYPMCNMEIIEIVSPGQDPKWGNEFLGYDIVDRHQSNIMHIILPFAKSVRPDKEDKFRSLLWALSASIVGSLNANQLFDDLNLAEVTLSMLDKIFCIFDQARPDHLFLVEGIYLYTE